MKEMPSALVLNLGSRTREMIRELHDRLGMNVTDVVACGVHVLHAVHFAIGTAPMYLTSAVPNGEPDQATIQKRIERLNRMVRELEKGVEKKECACSDLKPALLDPGPPTTIGSVTEES